MTIQSDYYDITLQTGATLFDIEKFPLKWELRTQINKYIGDKPFWGWFISENNAKYLIEHSDAPIAYCYELKCYILLCYTFGPPFTDIPITIK